MQSTVGLNQLSCMGHSTARCRYLHAALPYGYIRSSTSGKYTFCNPFYPLPSPCPLSFWLNIFSFSFIYVGRALNVLTFNLCNHLFCMCGFRYREQEEGEQEEWWKLLEWTLKEFLIVHLFGSVLCFINGGRATPWCYATTGEGIGGQG